MNLATLSLLRAPSNAPGQAMLPAVLVEVTDDGSLIADAGYDTPIRCRWLETGSGSHVALAIGDTIAVVLLTGLGWVALGRIGRYVAPVEDEHLVLKASQSVALQCGAASMTLRADGKVLIKGDDVLLHAKGTQRIRAGNVAIN